MLPTLCYRINTDRRFCCFCLVPGGSWFDYVLDWEETFKNNPHLPALVLYYEDIKEVR